MSTHADALQSRFAHDNVALSIRFFDLECLEGLDDANDALALMTYITDGLRFDSVVSSLVQLLLLFILIQVGEIPGIYQKGSKVLFSRLGITLWGLWVFLVVGQYVMTFISLLFEIMSVFGMSAQFYACLEAPSGAPSIFSATIPVLIFHPVFVTKNAALLAYVFTITQGFAGDWKLSSLVDVDNIFKIYCIVFFAPLALVAALIWVLSASFVFSIFFFVPMSVFLFGVCFYSIETLRFARRVTNMSDTSRDDLELAAVCVDSAGSVPGGDVENAASGCSSAVGFIAFLQQIILKSTKMYHQSLWWLADPAADEAGLKNLSLTFNSLREGGVFTNLVYWSSLLLVLSPLMVYGSWAAFYCYIGHSARINMAFVALEYRDFFSVFSNDWTFPSVLDLDLSALSNLKVLSDMPEFNQLPPLEMIKGAKAYMVMSTVLAFAKVLVSVIASIFVYAGYVNDGDNVGMVAADTFLKSFEDLLSDSAKNRVRLMEDPRCTVVFKEGKLVELEIKDKSLRFKIAALVNCTDLKSLNASGCANFTGTITGAFIRLISDIRKTHGHDAVNLKGCGRFVLAEDLSDIADIAHIDLGDIGSLEGTTSLAHIMLTKCH